MKKTKLSDEKIITRVQSYRNFIEKNTEIAVKTSDKFTDVIESPFKKCYKLAENSGYQGHMYHAINLQELVEEMALESFDMPTSNILHMEQVASRVKVVFNKDIRSDSEYNFIEDLIRLGYVRLYKRTKSLKQVYRSKMAWSDSGDYINQRNSKSEISAKLARKVQNQASRQATAKKVQKRHKNDISGSICNWLLVIFGSGLILRFAAGVIFNI